MYLISYELQQIEITGGSLNPYSNGTMYLIDRIEIQKVLDARS